MFTVQQNGYKWKTVCSPSAVRSSVTHFYMDFLQLKKMLWLHLSLSSKTVHSLLWTSIMMWYEPGLCPHRENQSKGRCDKPLDMFSNPSVLDNFKTQARILLALLIFLLSGHFYSKSLTQLSLLHISSPSCSWIFTGGIQVNCLCWRAAGEWSMSQQSSGHQSIFPK